MSAVALWVGDLERSANFYRDVIGVPLEYSDAHEPENLPHYETMWGEWSSQGPVEPNLWFNLYPMRDKPTSGAQLGFPGSQPWGGPRSRFKGWSPHRRRAS